MEITVTVLCGLAIAVGVLGSLVQVLPGPTLIAVAVLVWAVAVERTPLGWTVLGIAVALLVIGQVLELLLAGRRLKRASIPNRSILAGGLLGIVGFFVVPVVGLAIGLVLGIYLAEWARLGDARAALPSTRTAVGAVGIIVLVEVGTSLLAAAAWVVGAVLVPALG